MAEAKTKTKNLDLPQRRQRLQKKKWQLKNLKEDLFPGLPGLLLISKLATQHSL